MVSSWHNCKNLLVIRPDNMGDVIMMVPSLRALKQTLGCRITLLTSQMGSIITPHIPFIDDVLVYDLPWIKSTHNIQAEDCTGFVKKIKDLQFDGAVISTVYSQNPLPAALLAYMAGIPLRLAYCRENPYQLLTHWAVDKEPYQFIRHQVLRELSLVANIGAFTTDESLTLRYNNNCFCTAREKLVLVGADIEKPFFIFHPGVSEVKREYPLPLWIETAKLVYKSTGIQILITGASGEKWLTDNIHQAAGEGTFSVAGLLSIEEFIAVIAHARLVISVNTATVHIAAATNTPVIVLYALTNPQHTPWKVPSVVLPFTVPGNLQSKNEVVQYVQKKYDDPVEHPSPLVILENAINLLAADEAIREDSVTSENGVIY